VRTFCGQDSVGSLQMQTSELFGVKNFGLFEIYGGFARKMGVEPVQTFFGQRGRSQFFAILYGRLLWTASNALFCQKSIYHFEEN